MIEDIKWWCYKVLPLVYDDSLSYYEVLCKVVAKINEIIPVVNITDEKITSEVDKQLQAMIADGTFNDIINNQIFSELNAKVVEIGENETALEEKFADEKRNTTEKINGINEYYLNVLNFGADKTGVNDSTQAFKTCINTATTNGTKILIPTGNYNLTEPIITDYSLIYKNSGTYTNKPLLVSNSLKDSSYPSKLEKYVPLSLLKGSFSEKSFQSSVYIPTTRHVILGLANYNSDTCLLVETNTDFTIIYNRKEINSRHCNDLTYNIKTNKIYCAPITTNGTIIIINPTTLEIENTIIINGIQSPVTNIEYSPIYDIYFVLATNLYLVNSNFEIIKSISRNMFDSVVKPTAESATQGSVLIDNQFVLLSSIAKDNYWTSSRLTNINFNTGEVINIYDYPTVDRYDECESAIVIDNYLFLLSYDNINLIVRSLDLLASSSQIEAVNMTPITSTIQTFYVNEGNPINGNGLTKESPFNDLQYAFNVVRYIGECHIILTGDTVKTNNAELVHYKGFMILEGENKDIKLSRPLTIYNCQTVYMRNITLYNNSIDTLIKMSYTRGYLLNTVTCLGNGETSGTHRVLNITSGSHVVFENTNFNNCDVGVRIGNGANITLWQTGGTGNNILVNNEGGIDLVTYRHANATTVVKSNQYGGLDIQGYKTLN